MSRLDELFNDILFEIERNYVILTTRQRIFVEKWVEKLSEPQPLISWKRNRNLYGKLLLFFVKNKNLQEPFNKLPRDGDLGRPPAHLMIYVDSKNKKFLKSKSQTRRDSSKMIHDRPSSVTHIHTPMKRFHSSVTQSSPHIHDVSPQMSISQPTHRYTIKAHQPPQDMPPLQGKTSGVIEEDHLRGRIVHSTAASSLSLSTLDTPKSKPPQLSDSHGSSEVVPTLPQCMKELELVRKEKEKMEADMKQLQQENRSLIHKLKNLEEKMKKWQELEDQRKIFDEEEEAPNVIPPIAGETNEDESLSDHFPSSGSDEPIPRTLSEASHVRSAASLAADAMQVATTSAAASLKPIQKTRIVLQKEEPARDTDRLLDPVGLSLSDVLFQEQKARFALNEKESSKYTLKSAEIEPQPSIHEEKKQSEKFKVSSDIFSRSRLSLSSIQQPEISIKNEGDQLLKDLEEYHNMTAKYVFGL
ncbi:hypothetical protein ADUPG1_011494 [Aduncisulcus paluster]|uniref:DUF4485 domain-containing protein n=1 Tax=Aduncisulcus paluster TaxID=2918883 RepID=A0ABQ5JVW7_9EUKA|nr:hypothetical protein ADUPG1_011494 [Aduncisulcus paluster]